MFLADRMIKKSSYRVLSIFFIIALITTTAILLSKKPAITGRVVGVTGNDVYSDNLNLQINESGTYEWKVKNPGIIKSIKATGSVSSNGSARIYIERNGTRQLLFDSTKQLFDVNVAVLSDYKKIFQGDEVLIQITLLNLRGFGAGNVSVTYSIKDAKDNLIALEKESVFVETQAKFVRKLIMPAEISPGTYIASVEAYTNVLVGTGSDNFEVKPKYETKNGPELKYYVMGLAALVAIATILFFGVYGFRALKKKKDIQELKEKAPLEKAEKLEKEIRALEEAKKSGFISEESYKKEKKRIEERLRVEKK